MSEFVFLFRINDADQRAALGTPEQAQRSMEMWLAWIRGLEAGGHLKSRGEPLERNGKVVRGPRSKAIITDGPYAETKDVVAGFLVIRARDEQEAVQIALSCPILAGDGVVEVRPIMAAPELRAPLSQ
ncbi:MAG: YciI family protein [Acidobacteriota bacterium]